MKQKKRWFNFGQENNKGAISGLATERKGKELPENKQIIIKIAQEFKDQSRKDIQKWRNALKMAQHPETPKLYPLMDLYDDLMTDGHVQAQIQIRKDATLNSAFHVVNKDTGDVNEEATDLFNQKWFYDLLTIALDAYFTGTAVIEFSLFAGNDITLNLIPKRNVLPKHKFVLHEVNGEKGDYYNDDFYKDWVLQIGDDDNVGLLNNVIPNIIWKRNVLQSWAEFTERFGMPMIYTTTNRTKSADLDRIEDMLLQLGEASVGVFPEGTNVEFKEADRHDAFQVYNNFIERNNSEISKMIVGGSMISDDGSSRSQSEVHERNLNDRISASDKRNIVFIVNGLLIPLLRNQGYSFINENDRFQFEKGQDIELDKLWSITNGVLKEYDVEQDWITQTFGIPIIGKKKALTQTINALASLNLPSYQASSCCDKHALFVASATFDKEMKQYHDKLYNQIWDNKDTLSTEALITGLESLKFLKALHKGWDGRIDIDYNAPDHLALQMMEFNLFEFSASKTEARLASITDLLINKDKFQIKSFSEFKAEAEKLTKNFNTSWLESEYNLSVAVGQGSAQYLRFMNEKDTVTSFVQYQTVGDKRVRNEHQLLDGKVFNLSDKEARDLWPPNGYGCRCEMLQHIGDTEGKLTKGREGKALLGDKFISSQFNINRGDIKQVFTKEQFYHSIKGLDKKIGKMNYADTYGLKPYEKFKSKLKPLKLDSSITGDNVKELFNKTGTQNKSDFMGFEDYLKRKIILKKNVFDTHTKGHYLKENELRHQLFPSVKDTISNPDEVWLTDYKNGKFKVKYIKFFKNKVIVIPTELGDNNLEISTWYDLKIDEKLVRNGFLVKKGKL